MAIVLIFLLIAAVSFGIMYVIFLLQAKYRNGMMFAVKLPREAEKDRAVRRIRERYLRDARLLLMIGVVTFLPVLLPWTAFRIIYFLFWILAFSFAFLIPFRRANRELIALKKKNGWFVSPDGDDGDEYWSSGIAYHNPKDRRVFVEKRVGTGLTVNTGTLAGKLILGGSLGLAAAAVLFAVVMFIWSEMAPPEISFAETAEGERVNIRYFLYPARFAAEEMKEVALVDVIPHGRKTNGEATDKVLRGHFRLDGAGKATLYVFRNSPPFIRIRLEDRYIYYNEKDPDQTRAVYERLRQMLKPAG